MTAGRFTQAKNPHDVPAEHLVAYNEMCEQFSRSVLEAYQRAQAITIMRDLPTALQINALAVGAMSGSLVPLMLVADPREDAEVLAALQASMPRVVARARKMAEDSKKLR